ncbi:MAG: hypothetical protein AAGF57_20090 [Pseudomonadota bacterium]
MHSLGPVAIALAIYLHFIISQGIDSNAPQSWPELRLTSHKADTSFFMERYSEYLNFTEFAALQTGGVAASERVALRTRVKGIDSFSSDSSIRPDYSSKHRASACRPPNICGL